MTEQTMTPDEVLAEFRSLIEREQHRIPGVVLVKLAGVHARIERALSGSTGKQASTDELMRRMRALEDQLFRAKLFSAALTLHGCNSAVAGLIARNAELEADAKRLDWLDANNLPKSIGWRVGVAPLGNAAVSSVVFLGSKPVTIRQAIDAARAEAGHG